MQGCRSIGRTGDRQYGWWRNVGRGNRSFCYASGIRQWTEIKRYRHCSSEGWRQFEGWILLFSRQPNWQIPHWISSWFYFAFISSDFPPVCLPVDEPMKSRSFYNSNPFLVGYSITTFADLTSNVLLQDQILVVDKETCKEVVDGYAIDDSVDHQYSDRVICAGSENEAKCQYDAGGPLMMPIFENGKFPIYQIGVTTFGYSCIGEHTPGLYANVAKYADWIVDELKK